MPAVLGGMLFSYRVKDSKRVKKDSSGRWGRSCGGFCSKCRKGSAVGGSLAGLPTLASTGWTREPKVNR